MAGFTVPIVTGNYGTAASGGTVTFTPTGPMANNNVMLPPLPIVVTLSGTGTFSQALQSNGDVGTVPQGIQWGVTESIPSAPSRDYNISVPPIIVETNGSVLSSALNVVQLSTATATLAMVGQSITGTGIPASTTIIAAQVGNPTNDPLNPAPLLPLNSVQISANAVAGTALTVTIGATIDISALMPGTIGWT